MVDFMGKTECTRRVGARGLADFVVVVVCGGLWVLDVIDYGAADPCGTRLVNERDRPLEAPPIFEPRSLDHGNCTAAEFPIASLEFSASMRCSIVAVRP